MGLPGLLQQLVPAHGRPGFGGSIQLGEHEPEGIRHRGGRRVLLRCRGRRRTGEGVPGEQQGGGEVLHGDVPVVGIDEVFHHVPQLPDIAGPCVMAEKVLHRLRQAEVAVQLPAELLHQQEHIVSPLRQGWDDCRQGVQPVVEIPAESALPHLPFQRLVGGSHDADVHMDDVVAADPHDLPLL